MPSTVKSHFKAMGLYNFIRGVGLAYKGEGGGGLYLGGLLSGVKNMVRNDEITRIGLRNDLKVKCHYIWSYHSICPHCVIKNFDVFKEMQKERTYTLDVLISGGEGGVSGGGEALISRITFLFASTCRWAYIGGAYTYNQGGFKVGFNSIVNIPQDHVE